MRTSDQTTVFVLLTFLLIQIIGREVAGVDAFYGFSRLTLYEHANQEGDSYFMRVGSQCITLPEGIQEWASSVDTHETCTMVCTYPHCRNCVKLYPGSPGHYDLQEIDMNNQIVSVKNCDGHTF